MFGCSFEEALYDMSYANLLMYMATIPSYDGKTDKKQQEHIDADDPANRDKIEKLLFG